MNTRNGTTMGQGTATGVGEKLDERIDSIKDSVKGLVDNAEQKATQIKNRAIEVKDEALSRGKNVLEHVTDYIKTNPFKAVGIAFGAGYIGMRLFRR